MISKIILLLIDQSIIQINQMYKVEAGNAMHENFTTDNFFVIDFILQELKLHS